MKDIILLAFGKRGYAFAAYNLAYSIKHFNKNLSITLVVDPKILKYIDRSVFDKIILLEDLPERIDPASIKTDLYKYLQATHNLYIDVDSLAFQDIEPLFNDLIEADGDYLTDVIGTGGKKDTINYSIWATNDTIWNRFKLKDDAILPAVQSSWAYVKKSNSSRALFDKVKKEYKKGLDKKLLTMNWGGTLPDELFFSGVCAQKNIIPKVDLKPMFFGNKYTDKKNSELAEQYYFLSIYGNGAGRTLTKSVYLQLYDNLMIRYKRKENKPHQYKSLYIMPDKHANGL